MTNKICKNISFEECELAILRSTIDKAGEIKKKKQINSPDIKRIIEIVEQFIHDRRLLCYGGTAINNILPKEKQFYNKNLEIADYDFFSPNALQDAKDLADIFYNAGYTEVEAKSGIHYGTFKLFVNFIPVADITLMDKALFNVITLEAIETDGILYCPPDYLRMSMYLELSRPEGDMSRWEKVLKRLSLLNDEYPLNDKTCKKAKIQRTMYNKNIDAIKLYGVLKKIFIDQGLVFFGGYANSLYSEYLPEKSRRQVRKIPDFDLLSNNPEKSANEAIYILKQNGFKKVKAVKHKGIGEIIAAHYELIVNDDTVAFIYEPLACHSYNVVKIDNKSIKVASIDTMLSFYLAFIYANRPYYNKNRILCMAHILFNVQEKNKLSQKGLLRRFSLQCYGKQPTLETMRAEKSSMYKKLKSNKNSEEYEMWFLRYLPNNTSNRNNSYKTYKNKKCKKQTKSNNYRVNNNNTRKRKQKNSNKFGALEL